MKKLIITLAIMAAAITSNAQVFKATQSRRSVVKDTIVTNMQYEDRQGKRYPIVVNRKSGAVYIWKISRNGKGYRQYMAKDIAAEVKKTLK
jgi:hypothetical protein